MVFILRQADGSDIEDPQGYVGYQVQLRKVDPKHILGEGDLLVESDSADTVVVDGLRNKTRFRVGEIYKTTEKQVQPASRDYHSISHPSAEGLEQRRRLMQSRPRTIYHSGGAERSFIPSSSSHQDKLEPEKIIARVAIPTLEEIFAEPYMTEMTQPQAIVTNPFSQRKSSQPDRVVFRLDTSQKRSIPGIISQFALLAIGHDCKLHYDRDRVILSKKKPESDIMKVVDAMKIWGDETILGQQAKKINGIQYWRMNPDAIDSSAATFLAQTSNDPSAPESEKDSWNNWFFWPESSRSETFQAITSKIPDIKHWGVGGVGSDTRKAIKYLVINLSVANIKMARLLGMLGRGFRIHQFKEAETIVVEATKDGQAATAQIGTFFKDTFIPLAYKHHLYCSFGWNAGATESKLETKASGYTAQQGAQEEPLSESLAKKTPAAEDLLAQALAKHSAEREAEEAAARPAKEAAAKAARALEESEKNYRAQTKAYDDMLRRGRSDVAQGPKTPISPGSSGNIHGGPGNYWKDKAGGEKLQNDDLSLLAMHRREEKLEARHFQDRESRLATTQDSGAMITEIMTGLSREFDSIAPSQARAITLAEVRFVEISIDAAIVYCPNPEAAKNCMRKAGFIVDSGITHLRIEITRSGKFLVVKPADLKEGGNNFAMRATLTEDITKWLTATGAGHCRYNPGDIAVTLLRYTRS